MLWNRSLVMEDVETKSLWSHLLGKAMAGQLKGKTLKPIVSEMTTWGDWKKQHPTTTVLNMSRTTDRYKPQAFERLQKFVVGFQANGQVYSIPFKRLSTEKIISLDVEGESLLATYDEKSAVARLYSRKIDNRTYTFTHKDNRLVDQETNSEWNPSTGAAVSGPSKGKVLPQQVVIVSYKSPWESFHPESITLSK
jgi:hypothetical protein